MKLLDAIKLAQAHVGIEALMVTRDVFDGLVSEVETARIEAGHPPMSEVIEHTTDRPEHEMEAHVGDRVIGILAEPKQSVQSS